MRQCYHTSYHLIRFWIYTQRTAISTDSSNFAEATTLLMPQHLSKNTFFFINFEAASFCFFCQFCHVFLLIKRASPDTVIPIDLAVPTTILIADFL
jgi:hypothetical protein